MLDFYAGRTAGANYQEAIVQALRTARAVVLIFSDAANASDESRRSFRSPAATGCRSSLSA